jgi:S1-C subfamily serine protease
VRAKIENAERHQAAGVVVVNEQQISSRSRDLLPRSFVSPRDGEPARLPVAQLRREVVDPLLVSAGAGLAQLERAIDADLKPRSMPLAGWSCRLETDVSHTRLAVKNVIGVLEGSGPLAKETVVIGAHYDHVGFGMGGRFGGFGRGESGPGAPGGTGFPLSQMGGSAIHHGADDNASGTIALLEVARRLEATADRSGRRLVFIAFTAEETGLIGSAYYCRHPVFPLEDTTTMINMDMVGRLQDNKLLVGGLGTAQPFGPLVERLNDKHRFDLVKDPSGQGPSDHASFYSRRIPVIQFFTGFHEQYHRPTDRVETINVPGIRRIAELVTDLVADVRTLPTRPEYAKTGTFDRRTTLWAASPSTGLLPNYADAGEGVLLDGVVNNTAAARAGLKKGDRLMALKGQPVKNPAALLELARRLKPGEKVAVTVERDGQRQDLVMPLSRPPAGFPDARFGFVSDVTDIKDGVLVTEVTADSAAAKAGLKKGDRLVALAGESILDAATYFTMLRSFQPGETVLLTVSRDGKELELPVQAGEVPRGRPGAPRFGLSPDFRDDQQGVLLARVRENSPAAEAGLRAGDRITAINGQPVQDARAFTQAMAGLTEGDKVEFSVLRDGKTHKFPAVFK